LKNLIHPNRKASNFVEKTSPLMEKGNYTLDNKRKRNKRFNIQGKRVPKDSSYIPIA